MVINNPIMGGASRYLRITAVDGGDFQIFMSPDQLALYHTLYGTEI